MGLAKATLYTAGDLELHLRGKGPPDDAILWARRTFGKRRCFPHIQAAKQLHAPGPLPALGDRKRHPKPRRCRSKGHENIEVVHTPL